MKKTLLSAVAAVGIAAGAITIMSGAAQALSFDYYFTNTVGNVSGTVTGHVDGLPTIRRGRLAQFGLTATRRRSAVIRPRSTC